MSVYRERRAPARTIRIPMWFILAAIILVIAIVAAHADGMVTCGFLPGNGTCIWRDGVGDPYIRQVPQPQTDEEKAASAERERQWVARCHPTIVPDKYGVGRYQYVAAGCEFGR